MTKVTPFCNSNTRQEMPVGCMLYSRSLAFDPQGLYLHTTWMHLSIAIAILIDAFVQAITFVSSYGAQAQ